MTEQSFQSGLAVFTHQINAYTGRMRVEYADFTPILTPTESGKIYQYILAENWQDLKSLAEAEARNVELNLTKVKNHQVEINNLVHQLHSLKSGFRDYYSEPQSRNDWTTIEARIRADLSTNNIPQTLADQIVKRIGYTGGLHFYNYQMKQLNTIAQTLQYAFERHLAIYMYYYAAVHYAEFNKSSGTSQNLTYNISTKMRSLRNSLEGRLATILRNIKAKDKTDVDRYSNNLEQWVDSKINQEALPILIDTHQQWTTTTSAFYSVGKKAMKATNLLQQLLFHKASSQYLQWINNWHSELQLSEDFYDGKDDLVDETIVWPGQLTSIKDLLQQPAQYDSQYLLVRGKIKNINMSYVGQNKVLSIADVEDNQGRIMKVCLPYIKVDSGGMVEDSFVYIHGQFLQANPEANGAAAVSIKRLSLGDLAQNNWEAWLRLELKAIYELVPHNLATVFSASAGSSGLINPVKHTITFKKPNLPKLKTTV